MVSPEDRIKLIDFGISACDGARRLTFSKLSNAMGTPDYISPEQIKRSRIDGRSDIYSLGVILFEMLTAQTPFNGPNPFAVMNDRLVNDPAIRPRNKSRNLHSDAGDFVPGYGTRSQEPIRIRPRICRGFTHPESVPIIDRAARQGNKARRLPWMKRILSYTML